jgi:hypothetical protein
MEFAMDEQTKERIGQLAKEAAYSQSYVLPPKGKGASSKTIKLKDKKDKEKANKALKASSGNAQSPHRFGRKLKKR